MDQSKESLESASNSVEISKAIVVLPHSNLYDEFSSNDKSDFYLLAESMPQIVWMTRADGSNIYFNQQWVDYTGQTLEESYESGWSRPFHPEDKERALIAWQNATQNLEKYSLECRLRRVDGKYKWWLVQGIPIFNADKTIDKWIGSCTDIDELRLAEDALIESDKFTLDVMDSLLANIAVIDSSGVILKENEPWRSFARNNSGTTIVSSYVGINYLSVVAKAVDEESAAEALVGLNEVLQGKRDNFRLEYPCHSPTEKRWFMMNVSQLKSSRHGAVVSHTSITELKLTEELLRETELNLHLALESAKMGTWWMDIKSMYTEMSSSLSALYGIAETGGITFDLINKHVHPDDRAELQLKLKEALQSLKPLICEFRIIRNDGEIRWHYLKSAFTFNSEGKAVRLYGIQADNNESKIHADALAASEAKYRNLVANAQDAILIISDNGIINFVNNQLLNWFGYTSEELVGHPIEILVPERFRGIHKMLRDNYLAYPTRRQAGNKVLDIIGRRKDGSEFPVDIMLSPSTDEGKKIITAVIRDISDRKREEKRNKFLTLLSKNLLESNFYLDNFYKTMILSDVGFGDGYVLYLIENNGELKLKDLTHRNSDKQQILEDLIKSLSSRGIFFSNINIAITTLKVVIGNNLFSNDFINNAYDEEEQKKFQQLELLSFSDIPLIKNNKLYGILTLFSNMAEQFLEQDIELLENIGNRLVLAIENNRLLNEANDATKAREEILAIVSHDLKNSLTAIRLQAQLLKRNQDTEIKNLCTEKIERSTKHMEELIGDLIAFSKMQVGILSIDRAEIKIEDLINEVYESLNTQAEDKGIDLKMEVSSNLPKVNWDKLRIRQALFNLIGNALKFTQKGGNIHVGVIVHNSSIRFSVTDNGPGILKKDLLKIFDRYWQGQRTNSASAGLGLAITRGIIEAHGGKIWVKSKPGVETTFYFDLPVS